LDELPQLWDVVAGNMSLVGPRPEDPRYVALYDNRQRKVLSVRPGMTGPAVAAFRHEERILAASDDPEGTYVNEILPAKLEIDLAYVETRSFWGDLHIIAGTITALLKPFEDAEASQE
jgi:lipopolysaccharide/colanic/teichoic acid biosynthesis glycosyltransferase